MESYRPEVEPHDDLRIGLPVGERRDKDQFLMINWTKLWSLARINCHRIGPWGQSDAPVA